jgi:GxxExxY protein
MLFKDEVYQIMGACFAVYNDKGHGFVEPVYQECVEIELGHCGIPYESQQELALSYRGKPLKHKYIPDLLCYEKIIVELKAVKEITDEHKAQVMNYLKASGLQLGLLINFGHYPGLQWQRIVMSDDRNHEP